MKLVGTGPRAPCHAGQGSSKNCPQEFSVYCYNKFRINFLKNQKQSHENLHFCFLWKMHQFWQQQLGAPSGKGGGAAHPPQKYLP